MLPKKSMQRAFDASIELGPGSFFFYEVKDEKSVYLYNCFSQSELNEGSDID